MNVESGTEQAWSAPLTDDELAQVAGGSVASEKPIKEGDHHT
jgi:bacteriocin-like protein